MVKVFNKGFAKGLIPNRRIILRMFGYGKGFLIHVLGLQAVWRFVCFFRDVESQKNTGALRAPGKDMKPLVVINCWSPRNLAKGFPTGL